jgi:uncharacterized protein (TIGR03086 family)
MDLIDLYDRTTQWVKQKIEGAQDKLDAATPCEDWNVRDLLNHVIGGQQLFESGARGEGPSGPPPPGKPDDILSDDPAAQYEQARQRVLSAYREEGALEKGAMLLGIGVADQAAHGWDLAKATGQPTDMPDDIAQAAFSMVDGRLTDETRGHSFKPAVDVGESASAQDRYVAYMGRQP